MVHSSQCYLKRWFGSWNCLENVETKEAKWCIRTLFEECGPMPLRGAIECESMFFTEITLNKTVRYNVKFLASRCFVYYSQHSLFEHACIFANFKRHALQFKLCFCITMYTVGVLCLGCCYGGYFPLRLPYYQFNFKISIGLSYRMPKLCCNCQLICSLCTIPGGVHC